MIAENSFDYNRAGAVAGVSEDGTVYFIGGASSDLNSGVSSDFTDSMSKLRYVQRLQGGEWTNLGAMLSYTCAGGYNMYTQIADMLYFIANDDASTYSLLKRFDLDIGEETDSFEVDVGAIKYSCLVSWRSFLYVIGGQDTTTGDTLGETSVYDLDSESWLDEAVVPALKTGRRFPACAVNNDKIYVIGGKPASGQLDTVEYTHADMANEWILMNDALGIAMNSIKAVVYGDFIITVGGWTGYQNVADHFIVDTVQNTVTVSGALDVAMRATTTLLIGDVLLALGGYTNGPLADTRYMNLGLSVFVHA